MASHRRPKPPRRNQTTVLTTAALAVVALSAQSASADPAPDPTKKGVKAQVDRLYEEATQATEKYNGTKEKADGLEKDVTALQETAARKQADLNSMRARIGSLASAQYRSGGMDPSMQLMLSTDPDSFLEKASLLDQVGARELSTFQQFQIQQRGLQQQRAEASKKLADLETTRTELRRKKSEIQGKLASAQRLLNTLSAKEKARLAAEEERANRDSARVNLGNESSASSRAAAAFDAAKSRVGLPYVWGATGPGSFDCSGLTSWAFKQANVSIPRTSQAQANVGTRINSLSALKPGDLIIMRTDLSHVGFYAGNGQILHAPKPGAQVRYESIARSGMPFMWGVRI
ncbi:NlpC/P60 family protein [Streptomyces sp. Ncost-T10-10d]|uniref:C40 family peptidase n=1 Tax=Streptomyces sp. Ncost-T10-10d TaxID=1839774 RepID=UPI00081E0826|nr:NlpC/P60 family protein [Streptomyces sp. Ncost-T10-10d]SCF83281.1 Cell wall-associated hydrolase, NlpC family [Streptomyces sp. Ncost-T10-10d]